MANQSPMPQKRNVDPNTRAQLFSTMTRQHFQTDGAISGQPGGSVKFRLNKVRLTSRIRAEVEFKLKATHAGQTSYTPHPMAPYTFIRRVQVDMNNGFLPFVVSGKELFMYSLMNDYAAVQMRQASGRGPTVQGVTASSGGTDNVVRFLIDLPLSINDRDPVSLIVTQNQQVNVDVTIDFGQPEDLAINTTGYTFAVSNLQVTPFQETFSVPPLEDARPDISWLKVVHSANESIAGPGTKTIKLPTGMVYRKLAFYYEDSTGAGVSDSDINANFELVLNQADIPYVVKPSILSAINTQQFRQSLPNGVWAFDFSYQGMANYGGWRDLIDTEQLVEFWLRFNAPKAGTVYLVYEQLAKMHQNY